jgi:TonB family protein
MKIRGRTIRTLEGLLLSLLLHLLIFLLFFVSFKELKFPPPPPKSKKISLNIKQISTTPPIPPAPKSVVSPAPAPKPQPRTVQSQPKPQPVIPPVPPKPVVKKPVKKETVKEPTPPAKKKLLDEKARLFVEKKEIKENNVTKVVKKKVEKPKKKIVKKKVEKKKKKIVKKRRPKRPSRPKSGLAGALMGSGRSVSLAPSAPSSPNYGSRMIKQLYGSEFDSFTPTQKKFIKKNLGLIHRITQRTLIQNGYPDVAVRTMQEGTNVVTFYLHPNGNITNLRLLSRIGYTALDDNTLQVIRIAYKDYPHPKTKTKITFYVQYSIY